METGQHRYAEIIEYQAGPFDQKLSTLLDQITRQGGVVVKIDMQIHPEALDPATGRSVARTAQVLYIDTPGMQIDVR